MLTCIFIPIYRSLFTESNAYHIESDVDVINSIIPVSQRTNITEYSQISDKIYSVCEELDYNPYEINRYLFLLGSDFCQTLKCEFCCVNQYCYYNNLPNPSLKQQFNDRIRSNNSK